jgi:hypothetical protein
MALCSLLKIEEVEQITTQSVDLEHHDGFDAQAFAIFEQSFERGALLNSGPV